MYAIFNTDQDAQDFTDSIHAYLCENRQGYATQTEIWSYVIKHKDKELYAIPLPPEHIEGNYETIETLDGWMPDLIGFDT